MAAKKVFTEKERQEMGDAYVAGKSANEIGECFGITGGAVLYHLKKLRIPIRSFSETSRRIWLNKEFREKHKKGMATCNRIPSKGGWKIKKRKFCPSIKGDKNPNWKGGATVLNQRIRCLPEYALWRMEIFRRDKWTCQICGAKNGAGERYVFDADHIIPLHKLISKYQIKTVDEAISNSALWDVGNGRCLCRQCHKATETWGPNAALNIKRFALHPQNSLPRDTRESTLEEITQ